MRRLKMSVVSVLCAAVVAGVGSATDGPALAAGEHRPAQAAVVQYDWEAREQRLLLWDAAGDTTRILRAPVEITNARVDWSADGRQLLYRSTDGIHVLDVDTGEEDLVVASRGDAPVHWGSWFADGRLLTGASEYTDGAWSGSLQVRERDGSFVRSLGSWEAVSVTEGVPAPDGSEIAVILHGGYEGDDPGDRWHELGMLDASSGDYRPLLRQSPWGIFDVSFAGPDHVRVITDQRGSILVRTSDGAEVDTVEPVVHRDGGWSRLARPSAWSPVAGGGRVALALDTSSDLERRIEGAYLVDRTGGAVARLPHTALPARERDVSTVAWRPAPAGALDATSGFADVSGTHAAGVARAVGEWWMDPCGVTEFCPAGAATRRQMALALAQALALPDPGASAWRFDDVDDEDPADPAAAAIRAVADAGITIGCGDGSRFCPDEPVTRAQMATFFQRALELPAGDADFRDVPPDHAHAAGIGAVARAGITDGCGDGTRYCPDVPISRAQLATFLARAIG